MRLKDLLKDQIPPAHLGSLIKSFDIIGDIAVLIIPEILLPYEKIIAEAVLKVHRNVKTVLKRDGTYSGEHRVIRLIHLAGAAKTETICKEFGVKLKLDLKSVYFSVRLANERKRVANLVSADEEVLVMFSGVAPYPLMMAAHSEASSILGIEINQAAHNYGLENLRLNKASNITLIQGDAMEVLNKTDKKFDRVIMPLPTRSAAYLDIALSVLKTVGTLHYYDFRTPESFHKTTELIGNTAMLHGLKSLSSEVFVCGHNSPGSYRICVDAAIIRP